MPSSHSCFQLWEFFSYPSGAIHESFQFDSPKAIISEELFILSFQLSFSNSSGASFKYPLISSRSLRSRVSNSLEYFHALFNSTGVSSSFLQLFSILTVVRSRFLFPCPHINLFVVSILPVVQWRPSQVCAISILILSKRISSMPNPLLVINLIGEGYA